MITSFESIKQESQKITKHICKKYNIEYEEYVNWECHMLSEDMDETYNNMIMAIKKLNIASIPLFVIGIIFVFLTVTRIL